jgi:hypothetical protein
VLEVGISISLERPDKAKPKGRTMDPAELRVLKLGARGSKKKNRKCKMATMHPHACRWMLIK